MAREASDRWAQWRCGTYCVGNAARHGNIDYRARENGLGSDDLVQAIERVSVSQFCGLGRPKINFPRKIWLVLCGYFEHQWRVQCERCVAGLLLSITAIRTGSKWSCLLLRIVLQDAVNEVVKVYPPMLLKVFVDDIQAFLEGRNKEL